MRKHIKRVMAQTFDVAIKDIPDDAGIDSFPKWDSLGHLQLMLALETELGVHFSTNDMLDLLSLEALEDYLQRRDTSVTS